LLEQHSAALLGGSGAKFLVNRLRACGLLYRFRPDLAIFGGANGSGARSGLCGFLLI
jgi:hypothetical protein